MPARKQEVSARLLNPLCCFEGFCAELKVCTGCSLVLPAAGQRYVD